MNKLNAKIFIDTWSKFSKEKIEPVSNWQTLYYQNDKWTKKFIGGRKKGIVNSPIGDFFKKKFPSIEFRTEDGTFDLVFTSQKKFSDIKTISINHSEIIDPIGFYHVGYDVIIEIENESKRCWEEMTKLTWIIAPLKVLITYNHYSKNEATIKCENDILINNFSKIISQSNKFSKENNSVKYVLIVGNNFKSKLNWRYFIFNSKGKRTI